MNLYEATRLRQEKNFKKALSIYDSLWQENSDQFNEWDGWSYAFCLFKIGAFDRSLSVCRELYPKHKNFKLLRSLYARVIYYSQFKNETIPSLSILSKALKAIFKLTSPYEPYSLGPKAVFEFAKIAMGQFNIPWEEIEFWLNQMDPSLLDGEALTYENKKGRSVSLASNQEQWYATMIRVKGGQKKPEELLKVLEEARKRNLRWHYNNDIWFARKEAFAYAQLGKSEKAIKILRQILIQKRDWFLIYDLAQLIKDKKEKRKLLCRAALSAGNPVMKMRLYESLFQEFKDTDRLDAEKHLCLVANLRLEKGWDIPENIMKEIQKRNLDCSKQETSQTIKELRYFWEKFDVKERLKGKIAVVFPNNAAGFIQSKDSSFFFRVLDVQQNNKPEVGQAVSFEVIDSLDKKKKKPSKRAVKIYIES